MHITGHHSWDKGKVIDVLTNCHLQVMRNPSPKYEKNKPERLEGEVIKKLEFDRHCACLHAVDSSKPTLSPDTATYGVLQKFFTSDSFLNDLSKLSPSCATSSLEGYHGLMVNKYRPKHLYFKKPGFIARTKLAVLHHNHAIFEEEAGDRFLLPPTLKLAKHRGGEKVVALRKSPANLSWKKPLVERAMEAASKYEDDDDIDDKAEDGEDFEKEDEHQDEISHYLDDIEEDETDDY